MIKKEAIVNNKKIVNIDDKKLLWGLAIVFVIGTLVSGSFTGNAGRVKITRQVASNEIELFEGGIKEYPVDSDNWIRLDRIGEDGTIVVQVANRQNVEKTYIRTGHQIYLNGVKITNVYASYQNKIALLRID